MEVVMTSLRLTIRLKTSDESEAWRTAAESQGYSTLNKFIRTVVNKSILDLNANRNEVEQRNRQRIDELEHELDLTKAEVSERDRIIRSLKDEVMASENSETPLFQSMLGQIRDTIGWYQTFFGIFEDHPDWSMVKMQGELKFVVELTGSVEAAVGCGPKIK